ncbi:MAG: site-specific DNA-methyltransferase [Bacteroidia bacterium]|nr:site-specific DNA-methyltransferase [Bacteroidia bacterium]
MPTLQFKGKNIIWNHHLAVPFHTLDEVPELHYKPEKANGNMIIEGDNLIALKALLPQFSGRIKCVCIDPPYNTGEEGWAYNDKVNSPLINDWFGKIVGKDDLTKHDKWLCMMTPRLKIIKDLMSNDGAIFICIDENELPRLISLMDEIFGEDKQVGIITWYKKRKGSFLSKEMISLTEYIVVYKKADYSIPLFGGRPDESESQPIVKRTNSIKPLKFSGNTVRTKLPDGTYKPGKYGNGSSSVELLSEIIIKDNVITNDFELNGPFVWTQQMLQDELKKGTQVVVNTKNFQPRVFRAYDEEHHKGLPSFFDGREYKATTDDAYENLQELFGEERIFDYSKPYRLINYLVKSSVFLDDNSIVLDSYAGTGTTAHSVLDLNYEDSMNLSFILVQMTEASESEPNKNICKDITKERVKRAIDKYGYDSGFKYYRIGIPLDAETMLEGQLPTYQQFAKYVYYLCTGENLEAEDNINEEEFYVGEYGKQAIYLVYKQDYETLTRLALNLTLAEKIKEQQPGKKRIVYAPSCFLDEEYLTDNQIEYVGIPYNLFQRNQ